MEERRVLFAIPAAGSVLGVNTFQSLWVAIPDFSKYKNWEMAVEFAVGQNGIHLARNFLVKRFLDSDCTDLFFIDNDIACQPGAIMRMIQHPVDFVLGLYRLKHPVESYTYMIDDELPFEIDPVTGLFPINAGPAGFMRVRRSVIEKMVAKLEPHQWMNEPLRPNYPLPMLFDFNYRHGQYAGEDIGFCLDWKKIGGQVWLDPDITLHHTGGLTFSSNFLHTWNNKRANLHFADRVEVHEPTGPARDIEKFEQLVAGTKK